MATELEGSLAFVPLLSDSKTFLRLMQCSRKDNYVIKGQRINTNTNNNLSYLIVGFHP